MFLSRFELLHFIVESLQNYPNEKVLLKKYEQIVTNRLCERKKTRCEAIRTRLNVDKL